MGIFHVNTVVFPMKWSTHSWFSISGLLEVHQLYGDCQVLDISNTFLWPFPRIAAFDTNGSLSVEVFPRNSGRIWARVAAWRRPKLHRRCGNWIPWQSLPSSFPTSFFVQSVDVSFRLTNHCRCHEKASNEVTAFVIFVACGTNTWTP